MACAESGHCQSEDPGAPGRLTGWHPAGSDRDDRRIDDERTGDSTSAQERQRSTGGELTAELSVVSQVAEGLRLGSLTARQAAEQLEAYLDSRERLASENTTETVRSQDGAGGPLSFQRGTPENDEDRPGERILTDESGQISRRERQVNVMVRATGAVIPSAEKFANNVQEGLTVYWPLSYSTGASGGKSETSSGQETAQPEDRPPNVFDMGDAMSATLTAIVATVVLGQRAAEKLHAPRKPRMPRSGQDGSDRDAGSGTARPARR